MSCAAAGAVGIKERTMRTTIPSFVGFAKDPWNKGRLIGQKRPLKPKEVWAIRVRLQLEHCRRDLALFNLAIDSKLRGCDLVRLRVKDVCVGAQIRDRTTVIQQKRAGLSNSRSPSRPGRRSRDWIASAQLGTEQHLFPSRLHDRPHISTRQ